MIRKYPKSASGVFWRRVFKTVFVVELGFFAGTYYIWYKTNTSREYRHWLYNSHKWALEGYYKIGEAFGDKRIRKEDYKEWGVRSD